MTICPTSDHICPTRSGQTVGVSAHLPCKGRPHTLTHPTNLTTTPTWSDPNWLMTASDRDVRPATARVLAGIGRG